MYLKFSKIDLPLIKAILLKSNFYIDEAGCLFYNYKKKAYYIHRKIFSRILNRPLQSNEIVRFKNGNKLDCRRPNLLVCSMSEVVFSTTRNKSRTSSKYRGVSRKKDSNIWVGQIMHKGMTYHKLFHSEIKAAQWYDSKLSEFGLSPINFPLSKKDDLKKPPSE